MASQFPGERPPHIPPTPGYPDPGGSAGLVDRVRNILVTPATEWPRIAAEPATVQGLLTNYAAPLAAIGPVAGLIASIVFLRGAPVIGLVTAVIQFAVALGSVLVLALIIDALATSFGGQKNMVQATKLAIYASTAGWIAGILNIVPLLGLLAILASFYNLYLLWLGLPVLMRVPEDKKVGYFVVIVLATIVLFVIVSAIVAAVIGAMFLAATTTGMM